MHIKMLIPTLEWILSSSWERDEGKVQMYTCFLSKINEDDRAFKNMKLGDNAIIILCIVPKQKRAHLKMLFLGRREGFNCRGFK